MTRLAAALAQVQAACWQVVVHVALVALRPAAAAVDLLAPHLRPLSPRAGRTDRRELP